MAANREIGDTPACGVSTAGLDVALKVLQMQILEFWPPPTFLPQLPRTGRWRIMMMATRTRRWRTMGRTLRTMSTQALSEFTASAVDARTSLGNRIPRFLGDFPIPDRPGIGNRETGRFPIGREPGIGVPIRRAGGFLVCMRPGGTHIVCELRSPSPVSELPVASSSYRDSP